jgi:hypothetical protein
MLLKIKASLIYFCKIINNNLDAPKMLEYFFQCPSVLSLRHHSKFYTPIKKTDYERNPINRICLLYNKMECDIDIYSDSSDFINTLQPPRK